MKQHKTAKERISQKQKVEVLLFKPINSNSGHRVMRPGKTHKDKHITKCWPNRFANQLARAKEDKK